LIEAAKATGCKNLKIVTAALKKHIKIGEFEVLVQPAWNFFLI
jgi:hypothetical protein